MRRTSPPSALVWAEFATLYVAVTVACTWPLLPVFSTALPNDTGDPGLNAWILWWNAQVLPLTERWWNAPIFHPVAGALALSETLLSLSIVATPLSWAGLGAVATYNVTFLLSYPATALAAHALAYRLTGRHDASVIAGLAFGFSPYRLAQIPHIQMLWAMWMPLCLLALHRYLDAKRARDLGLAAAAWVLNALSCGYYLVYFPVLVALWMAWFVRRLRDGVAIGLTLAAASVAFAPVLVGYSRVQAALGLARDRTEIAVFSADLSGLWTAHSSIWLAKLWPMPGRAEGELYPGVAIVLLIGAAVAAGWRRRIAAPAGWLQRGLLACAALAVLVGFFASLAGEWQATIGGIEISLTRPGKVFFVAVVLAIAAWLGGERFRATWRARSPFCFYAAAAVVMLLFALGPDGHLFGHQFLAEAPYAWLLKLPGGDSMRVPARFAMLMALCLSIAAAIAFDRLRAPGAGRRLAAAVALVVALDGWPWSFRVAAVPDQPVVSGRVDPAMPIIEMPMTGAPSETEAMLRATVHRHPIFNGYSGYIPLHYYILEQAITARDPGMLETLGQLGPYLAVVKQSGDADDAYATFVRRVAGAPRYRTGFGPAFAVPGRRPPARDPEAQPLAIAHVAANSNRARVAEMLDGSYSTWWETAAPQARHHEVAVTFAEPVRLSRLELHLGWWPLYYPRHLRVQLADPGGPPVTIWENRTAGLAFLGALADTSRVPLMIDVPNAPPGRRFSLTILERNREYRWAIAEIRAFGHPAGDTAVALPAAGAAGASAR